MIPTFVIALREGVVTGLILVFVAAGLLATSLHTAHEAGWLNGLQSQAVDLSWLVQPGTVSGSLLTGMLGLQPQPTHRRGADLPALRGADGALRALARPAAAASSLPRPRAPDRARRDPGLSSSHTR